MTEWETFGVIVALTGFLAMIVKPVVNLTRSITKLTVVVEKLGQDLDEQRKTSRLSIGKLWDHNDEQDEKMRNHETRIAILELNVGEDA